MELQNGLSLENNLWLTKMKPLLIFNLISHVFLIIWCKLYSDSLAWLGYSVLVTNKSSKAYRIDNIFKNLF